MALPVNGSTHLIPPYYSFYRPRKDERLSWPSWLTCSGWLTHISGQPSAAGRAQDRESSPARDRRSTTVPHHQPEAKGYVKTRKCDVRLTSQMTVKCKCHHYYLLTTSVCFMLYRSTYSRHLSPSRTTTVSVMPVSSPRLPEICRVVVGDDVTAGRHDVTATRNDDVTRDVTRENDEFVVDVVDDVTRQRRRVVGADGGTRRRK